MDIFGAVTLLLIFCALFAYLNSRFVHLPPIVGFLLGSLSLSIVLLFLKSAGIDFASHLIERITQINFSDTVLYGILAFLLFAGALQFDVKDLAREKWVILTLATAGVIISTVVVGCLMYGVYKLVAIPISLAYTLLFGALISPTDPVICIGLLKKARIDQSLKIRILGEALLNDGIAIVLFVVLAAFASFQANPTAVDIGILLMRQMLGSILLGLAFGWILHRLLLHVDVFSVQLLITLGAVAGTYDLALLLETSGPITVVIMGLIVRNYHPPEGNGHISYNQLYAFWAMIDEFLNAALFVLLGFALLTVPFTVAEWLTGLVAIGVVLFGRFISVWIPIKAFGLFRHMTKNTVRVLTWAGLRGGISLALALTLPTGTIQHAILCATFLVVLFSALAQSLTLKLFLK